MRNLEEHRHYNGWHGLAAHAAPFLGTDGVFAQSMIGDGGGDGGCGGESDSDCDCDCG
jgi:hypothetical protein